MLGYYNLINKLRIKKLEIKYKKSHIENYFVKRDIELYLFGNGYTLNEYCLVNLYKKDCFVCNEIFKHEKFDEFNNKNNVLFFAMDGIESYKTISKKLEITLEETLSNFLDPIISKKNVLVTEISVFPYIQKIDINFRLIFGKFYLKHLLKNNNRKIVQIVKNIKIYHTPQLMILIGLLNGYKKINLIGLEHNYVKDILSKNDICGTHFYREPYKEVLELNMGKDLPREKYIVKLSSLFRTNANVFETYEQLANLAKEMGAEIIDHSNGSLFMFQDYSLWDLVEEKK